MVGDPIAVETGFGPDALIPSGSVGTLVGFEGPSNNPIILVGGKLYLFTDAPDLPMFFPIPTIASGTYLYCFGAGTQIGTPEGVCAVEALTIGDLVTTQNGSAVPVKWIGRQTVATRFRPAERLSPVKIAAGALGQGLPHSDLTVTTDHALLVDGVLCHAGALVNGTTITRVPLAEMGERFTVYHVETEAHEIILANGAPVETFIDNVSRRAFDNFAEFQALYGDVPAMTQQPLPRVQSRRQLPAAIKARLAGAQAA